MANENVCFICLTLTKTCNNLIKDLKVKLCTLKLTLTNVGSWIELF